MRFWWWIIIVHEDYRGKRYDIRIIITIPYDDCIKNILKADINNNNYSDGSTSDDDTTEDDLSESDYDSDSVDDTAPVGIAVNFEFSVQDNAGAWLTFTNKFMSYLRDFI